MTIELTDEMVRAFDDARAALNQEQMHGRSPKSEDEKRRAGLVAVLAIVERDHLISMADLTAAARRAYENGQRDEAALREMGF